MKQSFKTYLPAVIVTMMSVVLIGCFYLKFHLLHIGLIQLKGSGMLDDLSTLLGDGAILLGAASFSWFIFKKNLKESAKLIKMIGKKVHNLHAVFGWTALVLIALHGGYFLITDFSNRHNFTGIAAFLILIFLAIYGSQIKRFKNKYIKKGHFMLTIVWLMATFIHGGGFVIFACGLLLGLFILLSVLKIKQKEKALRAV